MTDRILKEEILINVNPREVRAALIEDGVVQEVSIERTAHSSLINNIYKGKVSRVLPGMQACFVDIGLDRTAFLHVDELLHVNDKNKKDTEDNPEDIREFVTEGQDILVQVVKDPIRDKGARLTGFIALPSRFLVLLPIQTGIRISGKIEDGAERKRLRNVVDRLTEKASIDCGIIVRTAAEGANAEALHTDLQFLQKIWAAIHEQSVEATVRTLLYEDLPLLVRMLRDMATDQVERVLIDSKEDLQRLQEFAEVFLPDLESVLELYEQNQPIFDLHDVEDELKNALEKNISLKSGGHVIIEQTEAMTTIDVNTGKYVGRQNLEQTAYQTNLEAAEIIGRQLRLRNLGGIIVIDFIDMDKPAHRDRIVEVLRDSVLKDHAHCHVTPISELGLVEMTRKRTRVSLQHLLCEDCEQCDGRGFISNAETVCLDIFRELLRQYGQFKFKEVLVLAHQDVVELLLNEQAIHLTEWEERLGKPIRLQAESLYLRDEFDVVLI